MISRSTVQRAPATEVRRAPATEHACYRINDSRQPGASVFVLSGELETDEIEANLKEGVLTVRIPKRAEFRPRKIEVRTA